MVTDTATYLFTDIMRSKHEAKILMRMGMYSCLKSTEAIDMFFDYHFDFEQYSINTLEILKQRLNLYLNYPHFGDNIIYVIYVIEYINKCIDKIKDKT